MTAIFPDLFRAAVTDIMLVFLLYIMSRPRYSQKSIYVGITLFLVAANLLINTYFYLRNDYTSVALVDLFMLLAIAVLLKPLFQETVAQWCFSFITLLNIYAAVVIISYSLCDFFPYPYYANTGLRFFLFGIVIIALKRYFLPLYREVLKRWNVYILILVGLFINLSYFMFGEDVEQMLTDFMWPLLLLILLEILIYISIFYGMNILSRESVLKEENLRMQNERELLNLSARSMMERLRLMNEAAKQQSIITHDQRHFNSTILELLDQGKLEDAAFLLQKQTKTITRKRQYYCENTTVNATVAYYASMAQSKGIDTNISLEIPNNLDIDSLELSTAIANLLENAIHGCEALPNQAKKHIHFVCHHVGRLVIEISNPCLANTTLDENGYPFSQHESLNIGTKSVIAFASKYDAELLYSIENNIFTVRLLV